MDCASSAGGRSARRPPCDGSLIYHHGAQPRSKASPDPRRPATQLALRDPAARGIEETVLAHLETDVKVTVTASPRKGLDTTLELSERLGARRLPAVPHLSARLVRDRAQLDEVLDRLLAAGCESCSCPPATPRARRRVPGRGRAARGDGTAPCRVRGDRHHRLPREPPPDLRRGDDPRDVRQGADGDPHHQPDLLRRRRSRTGSPRCAPRTDLPIWIGMPGQRRLREADAHLDEDRAGRVGALPAPPRQLDVAPHHAPVQARPPGARARARASTDPAARVAGFHLYTFNEVARTERWRRRTLARSTPTTAQRTSHPYVITFLLGNDDRGVGLRSSDSTKQG